MTTINIRRGNEGPQHDQYGFKEFIFKQKGKEVIYHLGLNEWIKINGKKVAEFDQCNEIFELETGLTPKNFVRSYNYLQNPKKCKCGSKKLTWTSGFPGENLLICNNCNTVVSSYFDESFII